MDELFADFKAANARENLGVYGIHVYQKGKPDRVARFRCDDRVHLFSGAKAFTSVAVGMASDEGRLSLADRVVDFFGEYRASFAAGCERMTVKDLLQMRTGHMSHGYDSDETLQEQHEDWADVFLRAPMREPTRENAFYYENTSPYMLGRIIEKVSGESLRDYLMPRLFTPLDIPNPQWHTCPRGHTLGGTGLHLKTSEFARLGVMLLNYGSISAPPATSCWA